jgi:hypothetical protein
MANSIDILEENYKGENNSFIYYLHERSEFNADSFRIYLNSLIDITNLNAKRDLDSNVALMVVKTYDYILRNIIYHFSPNDLKHIKNLPNEDLFDYIDNLRVVLESFLKGEEIDNEILFHL